MPKEIHLTKGYRAIVDDEDFGRVSEHRWYASVVRRPKNSVYAMRSGYGSKASRKNVLMHRFILNLDPSDKRVVDHINHNPLDNRKENLRVCTHAENSRYRKVSGSNSSGYKGVHWANRESAWIAKIMVDRKPIHLGSFSDAEQAHNAYCAASKHYHKEFSCTN